MKELERAIDEITEIATSFGLDFFPMRYEICPADIMCTMSIPIFIKTSAATMFSYWEDLIRNTISTAIFQQKEII